MFKVKKEKCEHCLFTDQKIVSNSRRLEILASCRMNDSHFICHKSKISGGDACCKGFYDAQSTNLIRVMDRLGAIEFV